MATQGGWAVQHSAARDVHSGRVCVALRGGGVGVEVRLGKGAGRFKRGLMLPALASAVVLSA